jgi:hypothetical protein
MEVSLRRREFLAMMAALGTTGVAAQAPSEPRRRIDLHHHFGAPPWTKRHAEVKRQGWETS